MLLLESMLAGISTLALFQAMYRNTSFEYRAKLAHDIRVHAAISNKFRLKKPRDASSHGLGRQNIVAKRPYLNNAGRLIPGGAL